MVNVGNPLIWSNRDRTLYHLVIKCVLAPARAHVFPTSNGVCADGFDQLWGAPIATAIHHDVRRQLEAVFE